jgi:hypothetical protein
MARWKKFQTLIASKPGNAYRCPVCGSKTLHGRGQFELCPVCYWEDDGMDQSNPKLEQARENYQKLGASAERWLHDVRPPRTGER